MSDHVSDNAKHLDLVQSLLLPSEELQAVLSLKGDKNKFLCFTSHRIITNAYSGHNDWQITSIPYRSLTRCDINHPDKDTYINVHSIHYSVDLIRGLNDESTRYMYDLIVAHMIGIDSRSIAPPVIAPPDSKPKRWF